MLLLLVGLLAILSQIVLLRELNVAFYGVELVYALALAVWMAGTAVGSMLRFGARAVKGGGAGVLLVAAAAALPAEVAAIRGSRFLLGGVPGAYLPFGDQVIVLVTSLIPQAAMLGLAFRWAAEEAARRGSSLARSYAVESAGACLGAAAATAGFMAGVQTFTVAVVTAGAVPPMLQLARRATGQRGATGQRRATGQRPVLLRVAIGLALTGMAAWLAPRLDLAMTRWSHPALVESRDSPYARITATRAGSQSAIFLDDVLVYESESANQEELAHVAALAHSAPRRVLVLGGSVSGIDRELAKHAPERMVAVEMDRTFVEVGRRLARAPDVVVADPRRYLKSLRRGSSNAADSAPFDLVVIATPQPTSGQSNRFYTREFFEECRDGLAPGGILALRLDLPENVISPLLVMRTASVVAALREVFPSTRALHGTSAIVLASTAPLPADAGPLVDRWRERGLSVRLVSPAYLHYLWENDRRGDLEDRLHRAGAPSNTDARPVCYQVAAAGWLAMFFPRLLTLEPSVLGASALAGVLGAAFGVLILFGRRSSGAAGVAQAGLAGLAGMLLETVLVLAYQAQSGALYEHLGLLLLAFMLGLAAGAAWVSRMLAGGRARHRPRGVARWVNLSLALLAGLVAVLVRAGLAASLWSTAVLMLAAGGLTAAIFATLVPQPRDARVAVAAPPEERPAPTPAVALYAADLAGGAVGSLLAGMILVPSVGLGTTAWMAC